MSNLTLPTDSKERKFVPMASGLLAYFPAALAGVAKISYQGNQKHNPGMPMQHSRWLSTDHEDCVLRHLLDTMELINAYSKDGEYGDGVAPPITEEQILTEVSSLAWRALALSQELHERLAGSPLAPAAKLQPED